MALDLNVDADEFVPSTSTNSKSKIRAQSKASSNTNAAQQSVVNNNGYSQQMPFSQSIHQQFNHLNIDTCTPAIPSYSNNDHSNQAQFRQNNAFIPQQQQQQNASKALIRLFPTIESSKLEQILQSNVYDLKLSILHILKSKELKGSYDQNICIYHLSNSCQHRDNPSMCRYKHDKNVPSAICVYWLSNACIKGEQCPFLHNIPINQQQQQSDESNNEELILMLTAMFPDEDSTHFKKLLDKHDSKIKPVVATLLQHDDWSTDSLDGAAAEKKSNERPLCRYYLKGECKYLDCMYSHDTETRSLCKYWLWGYCSRGNQCIYRHALPTVNVQKLQYAQQQNMKKNEQLKKPLPKVQQKRGKKQVKKYKKPPSDLVAKLRLNLLKESFPRIASDKISKIFVANEYDLELTKKCLMQRFGVRPIDVINDKQSKNMNLSKKMKTTTTKQINYGLMDKIGWVETGDSLNSLYKQSRQNAEEHARRRNECFMKAVDAYLSGNRKLAKDFSLRGREHQREMKKLHNIASNQIYNARNGRLRLNVIDLHGLHVEEGVRKLNERIVKIKTKNKKKKKGEYVLDILTGTGHHSFGGQSKLNPAIVSFAKKHKIKYQKMNFIDGRGGNIRFYL